MEWMDELEKAVRRAPEMDEEDGDGEDGMEQGEMPCPPMKKGVNKGGGDYSAAENGDDDDSEGVGVHAPNTLDEVAPQRGGKKQKLMPTDSNQVKKSLEVSDDLQHAMDASDVLESLVKSIEANTAAKDAEIAALRAEVSGLSKGLGLIGRAVTKSLKDTSQIHKSLTQQVEDLGRKPAGRKSTVRAIEKSFAGGNAETPTFPSKEQRMAKSLAAIKAGTISPVEVSLFEASCNRGEFRQDIWRKMGGE